MKAIVEAKIVEMSMAAMVMAACQVCLSSMMLPAFLTTTVKVVFHVSKEVRQKQEGEGKPEVMDMEVSGKTGVVDVNKRGKAGFVDVDKES